MSNRDDSDSDLDLREKSLADTGRESQRRVLSKHEGTDSANIAWSKKLIKTLEQTTRKSATLMHRVRSYHETRQMLDVSKKMSEDSTAQVNRARLHKGLKGKEE